MKKYLAIGSLVLSGVLSIQHLLAAWQIHYVLTSPLIPPDEIDRMMQPHFQVAMVTLPIALLSALTFWKRYYIITILLGVVSVVWELLVVYTHVLS